LIAMEDQRFDAVTRELGATRRSALGWLAGGLGLLVAMPDEADAKKRKKKRKKKKDKFRCTPDEHVCPTTTERDCCNLQCCLASGQPANGIRVCTSWLNTCCPPELGSGACPFEYPVCCGNDWCAATEEGCLGVHDASGRVSRVARLL
jgi:hypothetical protein